MTAKQRSDLFMKGYALGIVRAAITCAERGLTSSAEFILKCHTVYKAELKASDSLPVLKRLNLIQFVKDGKRDE
jgi:hypothetical protein